LLVPDVHRALDARIADRFRAPLADILIHSVREMHTTSNALPLSV
jgi:hypothetical protein